MSVVAVDSTATSTGGRSASTKRISPVLALAVGAPSSAAPPGWQWRALSELARLESGHTPSRRHPGYWGGSIPWVSIRDAKAGHGKTLQTTYEQINDLGILNSSARVLPAGTVCLSRTASVGYVTVLGQPMATSQDFVNWVCGAELEPNFLKYLFFAESKDLLRFASGSVHQTIYFPEAKAFHVCMPERSEQQRIVAILDDAFEGIAAAKTNAEKNLQNARNIFDTHLLSILRDAKWTWKTLGDLCDSVEYGSSAKSEAENGIPVLRMGNIQDGRLDWGNLVYTDNKDEIDKYLLKHNDVLFNRTNSPALVGKTAIYKSERPAIFAGYLIRIHRKENQLDADFLTYFLNSQIAFDYGKTVVISSVNQANINGTKLRSYPIPAPSLTEQKAIVSRLNELAIETRRLTNLYCQKLAALEELKKSLLRQAFSGRLTSFKQKSISQQPALQTTTPEFTANVISIAHARHERLKREKTFGRVKEQKMLHLVESIAGIDLGRQPMRDAAGPNDFQHMLKAEDWAKAQGFFEMVKSGDGYELRKLSRFDEYMSRARHALAPYMSRLEPVIDLLVPLDKTEAEVFATVHAAWNNLLIDGVQATDDAIVLAARQDWHPDKLKIPEHKFRTAIEKIRQKKLIPTGSAKYVGGQKTLFGESELPMQRR